jgi:hypothetical protein
MFQAFLRYLLSKAAFGSVVRILMKGKTMMWAKTPAAASSIFCAVCIATAAVLPAVGPAADRLANAVNADVNLKVNWGALANFDAVPLYQLAAGGNPAAILALPTLNAIPGYLAFALGDVTALGGLDSLSAVPVYAAAQAAGTGDPALLAGIDAFSGVPGLQKIANGDRTGYYDLESTNGMQAFDKWAASGYTDLNSFVPNDDPDPTKFNAGYAALSGLQSYKDVNTTGDWSKLSGIDAFSAIPSLQVLGDPASTQEQIWDAQRSLDSVSAIPEYQTDAPVSEPDPPSGEGLSAKLATQEPVVKTADKPSNGSYSANFSPTGAPVLFGSGGGKNSPDNGMPAYAAALKGVQDAVSGALGGGSAPSADAGGATP